MKALKNIFFCAILFCISNQNVDASIPLPNIPSTQFLITDYGATTSSTDNATAINAAITAANKAGGGMVVLPAGIFLSGPITMKSNVNLYLASGDTLRILPYGSGNGTVSGTYPNNGTTDQYAPFIFGQNLSNIAVSGSGVIDGQGSAWWTAYASNSNMKRPCLIRFKACNTVLVTGITLMNSPGVHLTMGQSSSMGSNATISYLTILAPASSPNTDAIDTWYWNGIYIHDCYLSEGDDNIAMDSYSQNVTIKHCTFGTGHGLSVGSYATGVNNVFADSCTFTGTTNGIRLKSNIDRGGNDSTFVYTNMTMTNVTLPFYITSWYDKEPYPASSQATSTVTSTTPIWRNIIFKNITVNNATYGGIIYGRPEAYVQNITFDNVTIDATSRGMVVNYVSNMKFINCSSLTIPSGKGNPFLTSTSSTSSSTNKPYNADISGINLSTGASTSCSSGIEEVTANQNLDPDGLTEVYSITGQLIKKNVVRHDAERNLPNGIYIIDHQKVIVNK